MTVRRFRLLAISTVALFIAPLLPAQEVLRDSTRSLEDEILSRRDRNADIVANSRRMLLEYVREGNTARVGEIVRFLETRFNGTRTLPLWPGERLLLSYWSHDFRHILNAPRLDQLDTMDFERFIPPPRDFLFEDLRDYSREHRSTARAAIIAAPLEPMESGFLRLFLDYLVHDRKDSSGRTALNADAEEYLAQFRESPYAGFVRREIRFVVRESDWGYGFDIGVGTGFISGGMGTFFGDNAGLTIGFDLGRRQLIGTLDAVLYARAHLGAASGAKTAFEYGGIWQKDLPVSLVVPELSFGIVAIDYSFVQVTPFAGISGLIFSPEEEERKKRGNDDVSLEMFSYTFGVNIDWKAGSGAMVFPGTPERSYWFVRTRVAFNAPFSPVEPRFGGNVVTLSLSFGGFGRSISRDF